MEVAGQGGGTYCTGFGPHQGTDHAYEQSKAFEQEIAIATPGRMIDMIKMKVTNLERVPYHTSF